MLSINLSGGEGLGAGSLLTGPDLGLTLVCSRLMGCCTRTVLYLHSMSKCSPDPPRDLTTFRVQDPGARERIQFQLKQI